MCRGAGPSLLTASSILGKLLAFVTRKQDFSVFINADIRGHLILFVKGVFLSFFSFFLFSSHSYRVIREIIIR